MLRMGCAFLVSLIPLNWARVALMRWLFGYRISWDSRIGWGTLILAGRVELEACRIGPLNWIQCAEFCMGRGSVMGRLNAVRMLTFFRLGEGAVVVNRNCFFGTRPGISPFKEHERITIGPDSIITSHHAFDAADEITLGRDVTFGGSGSQVWTHGFDLDHVKVQSPVVLGDRVYVGTRVLVLPGVSICDHVSIGAGSVVSSSIQEPGFYVSSLLQRKGDAASYASDDRVVYHAGARFVRK